MADEPVQGERVEMRAEGGAQHRKAFVVGTLLGAGAGVVSAYLKAPRSGRATRADIQQGIEGVLFKILDMRPTRTAGQQAVAGGTDEVTAVTGTDLTLAAPPRVAMDVPTDIVLDGPRPADLHA